jgi:hypothetical protein
MKMKKQKNEEEFVRILNCNPSRNQENDWLYENAEESGILAAPLQLPPSVDLREPWWSVGDQKATGSCVGWATADSVLRWHFVKAGKIASNQILSIRFIWMASKETDEFNSRPTTFIEGDGTSLKAALDIARKYGSVLVNLLPFQPILLSSLSTQSFYAIASNLKIASYFNLGVPAMPRTAIWKTWLAAKGPILTRLGVDQTWDNATQTNGNLDVYKPNTVRGGHAVAIVGYTNTNRFIVRNSWGTNWGDKGFAYASMQYSEKAFTESYGVQL